VLKYQLNRTRNAGEEAFKKCVITSLMTSQGPDRKSVRKNYFPQVGDHRVKKSAQASIGQKLTEKKHFENCGTYKQQTQPQNSTLPENKGCLKL